MTFGQKVPKLSSRPVYCSRLYGIYQSKLEKGIGLGLSSKGNWITRAIRLAKNEEVRSVEFTNLLKISLLGIWHPLMKEKSYSYIHMSNMWIFVPEYGFDKTRKIGTWRNEDIQRWNPIKKNDKTISIIRRIPTTVNYVTKHWKRILSKGQ